MTERVFTTCLNQELKAFNCSIGSLIGSSVLLLLFGVGKGLMWGLGGAVVGFIIGRWLSKEWHLGNVQRVIFRNFPYSKFFIDRNIPESHHRWLN